MLTKDGREYLNVAPTGLMGYKSCTLKSKPEKCAYCHKKYTLKIDEMEYTFMFKRKLYHFCDYNCRSKWKKENQEIIDEYNNRDKVAIKKKREREYAAKKRKNK